MPRIQEIYFKVIGDYIARSHIMSESGKYTIAADTIKDGILHQVGHEYDTAISALEELIKMILKNYSQIKEIYNPGGMDFVNEKEQKNLVSRMNLSCQIITE